MLDHVQRGGRDGRREREEPGAAARRPKVQKGKITKMSGLHREKPLGGRTAHPLGWRGYKPDPGLIC